MRISELSRKSKVAAPTIKFYVREGLLPPGSPTARNQARYTEQHLARLRFIRTLITVGRLPLASIREVLAAVDATDLTRDGQCRLVQRALRVDQTGVAEQPSEPALAQTRRLISGLGWRVQDDAPGITALAQVLDALTRLGWKHDAEALRTHAAAAQLAVRHERIVTSDLPVATVAACYVLFEVALVVLRGIAHEDLLATAADGPSPA